jgi:anti-sigma B factor antagonist
MPLKESVVGTVDRPSSVNPAPILSEQPSTSRAIAACPPDGDPLEDGFSTKVVRDGDATLIYVTGEIDTATCARLRDAIEPHLGPQQTIILDLSGVAFMDSACLHVLVQARGTLTADGGSLFLRNPSKAAHRLLTISGLEDLLQGGNTPLT